MLLDVHKISLIYDFWLLSNEDDYLQGVTELSKKLLESDTGDVECLRQWIPDVMHLIECWDKRSMVELDSFYMKLLDDEHGSDQVDALLRFLYDIQSYEMVQYLLEKNVQQYKKSKIVSSSMTGFHEACIYGFSQVCSLYIRDCQDVNEPFSLIYTHAKSNRKEFIRNLTGLQLVCLWSKYFPKRLVSYAHTVRLLLNHGARVNMTSTELTTALHWVCRAPHTSQLAQDLIDAGASIIARDRLSIRPIHFACWSRNRIIVDLLLKKGARLTDIDDLGRTPMHFLCMPKYAEAICITDQQDQVELMKSLLEYDRTLPYRIDFTQKDHHGYTYLGYACISHNLALIELLLEHEPKLLNAATLEGQTPLMISINEGFTEGVQFFLRQTHLEHNACDQQGNTAIHHACLGSKSPLRLNILRMLLTDGNGRFDLEKRNQSAHDPLMLTIINQSIDACRLLIDHGVTVNKTDLHSRQSLHIACQLGSYELVAILLKSSQIDINALDDCHRNCLFYAISSGQVELVKLLIEHHVVIRIRDMIGDTPLHLAVQQEKNANELTRLLLETDAGKSLINVPAADGMQPLLLAAQSKQADIIHLLLKNDADRKAVDREHHNALHLACKSACMKCAFYLIEFGEFDVNALDCYRQTPIFYAYASNDDDLVQYLISCGAQIDLRNNQNYLPLHMGILSSENEKDFNVNLIDIYKEKHENLLDDQNNECEVTPLILAAMQGKFNVIQHLILNSKVNIMAQCSNGHTALHYACLMKSEHSLEIVKFLMRHGCTLDKVDQPKGSFLYTIVQYGDRAAMRLFMDEALRCHPNVNALYYDGTLLDLLYNRAQIHHHDLDIDHLRSLFDRGARFYSTNLPTFPCPLINDCPQFYLILLEYNCISIVDKSLFIRHLLHSIVVYPENALLFNRDQIEWISICDYFLHIVKFIHYHYCFDQLFSLIEREFLPILHSQQPSEEVHQVQNQLEELRSKPLKLSEIVRKRLRLALSIPSKTQLKQLGFTGFHLEYLCK